MDNEAYLSERALEALLSFRPYFLDRDHFPALRGATQHNAGAAGADELARAKVFRENESVLWKGGRGGRGGVGAMRKKWEKGKILYNP
jgi:hypothetical protein